MNNWFRRSPLMFSVMGGDAKYSRKSSSSTTFPCWSITMAIILVQFWLMTRYYNQADQYEPRLSTPPGSSAYLLAKRESLGFFDDISQSEWQLLKQKVAAVYPNTYGHMPYSELIQSSKRSFQPNHFYQNQFEPDFACRHERRIGRDGDGGKWVCDPHRIQNAKDCLVYSVGSNGDISFEQAVKSQIGSHCEIHTFDMGNYSHVVEQTGAHFHQWGISHQSVKKDGRGRVFKTLEQTVKELGHVGRTIDIFKIDCEGCEMTTYRSFFQAGADLRQILIELHAVAGEEKKSNQKSNTQVIPTETVNFFEAMYQNGYVIFHKEINIRWWHVGQCIEYAFLKLHKDFFSDIPGYVVKQA